MPVQKIENRKEICICCHDKDGNGNLISDGGGFVTFNKFNGEDCPIPEFEEMILGSCDLCGFCCGEDQEH